MITYIFFVLHLFLIYKFTIWNQKKLFSFFKGFLISYLFLKFFYPFHNVNPIYVIFHMKKTFNAYNYKCMVNIPETNLKKETLDKKTMFFFMVLVFKPKLEKANTKKITIFLDNPIPLIIIVGSHPLCPLWKCCEVFLFPFSFS